MSRILCLIGIHRRSVGRIDHRAAVATSVCKRCSKPMYKNQAGAWVAGTPVLKATTPEV